MDTKLLANGALKLTPTALEKVEVDIHTAQTFYDAASVALGSELRPLLIDMESITYLDSAGMWALEKIYRMYRDAGLEMVLFNINRNVERALILLRFNKKAIFFKTEAEAVQYFT